MRGYEDGFAQTCVPVKGYGYGCPPERRMHQPYHFVITECISDVTPVFLQVYYAAHVDFFNGQPYNETAQAPPIAQKFYYDIKTGEKIPDDSAGSDYIQGYQLGWKDAKQEKYQVDC